MTDPPPRILRTLHRLAQLLLILVVIAGGGVVVGALVLAVAEDVGRWALVVVAIAALLLAVTILLELALRRFPPRTLLVLDLGEPVRDIPAGDPLARLAARRRPSLRDIVEVLEHAASDKRVRGLVVRIGQPARGLADVQELRDALLAFRERGKFALAFAESFGEFDNGAASYYLACACDEVVLQPSGDVGLTGVAAEVTFVRGTLDKLGIEPQLDHRHEFKSAKEILTDTAFTPAHREAISAIVDSVYAQIVAGVAAGRRLAEDEVRAKVDGGPMFGSEAVDAGLVDRLGYRDEVIDAAKARIGNRVRAVDLADYARRTRRTRPGRGTATALIHGSGPVVVGHSRPALFVGGTMGSDTVTAAFRAAVKDKRVRAILFRLDSPGGSSVASDAIWREVCRARESGKPVVVSMGNVAGSGGYFAAMGANRIVAQPATLTGSIGVVAGKLVVTGLNERLGLSTGEVHTGANALLWSRHQPYTAEQWQVVQRSLDRVYDDFVAKAAHGRRLELERMHELAKGRVWTGADAYERGLVDGLGGYREAQDAIREELGLAAGAPLRLLGFPRRHRLFARGAGGGEGAQLHRLRMPDLRLR